MTNLVGKLVVYCGPKIDYMNGKCRFDDKGIVLRQEPGKLVCRNFDGHLFQINSYDPIVYQDKNIIQWRVATKGPY